MKRVAVFDLDNCLSNDGWRQRVIPEHAANHDVKYDLYHRLCAWDEVGNEHVVHKHLNEGERIVFITTQPRRYEQFRLCWFPHLWAALRKGGCPVDEQDNRFRVLYRPDWDYTPTPLVKLEHIKAMEMNGFTVTAAYDDRPDVINAYLDHGLNAYQLAIHNEEGYHDDHN